MQTKYGKAFFTKLAGTKEDLNRMILSVTVLPDIKEVVDGAVMQLRAPQTGYSETHFYRADKTSATEGVWVDITDEFVSNMTKINDAHASWHYEPVVDPGGGEDEFTGYLEVMWTKQADISADDKLVYTVVVRKLGSYPSNPDDGHKVSSMLAAHQTSRTTCRVDDMQMCKNESALLFKYTVFHVFESGSIKYVRLGE